MAENDTKDMTGTPGHRRRQNMAASVRSRLTMRAHAEGEEPEYVLTRYALERLLYRLGKSPHADAFILKGALLFLASEELSRFVTGIVLPVDGGFSAYSGV